MRRLAFVGLLVGCVDSSSVECPSGAVCPTGTSCAVVTVGGAGQNFCVDPGQLVSCDGQPDTTSCTMPDATAGNCHDGVCLAISCSNRLVDLGEACDDGNTLSGDGCSSDCRSDETCGNGVTDPIAFEQCDDGNRIDHDGCTSTCLPELPRWQSVGYGSPPARTGAATVYDATHHVVVMFGGQDPVTNAVLADTWLWDGRSWVRPPTQLAPSARTHAAMAYDAARHRVLLFGGAASLLLYNDTWAWDGETWTQVFTAVSPSSRVAAGMTYDAARKKVVLYGGATLGKLPLTDTWEWDGTTWSPTTMGTPVCRAPVLTYDPVAAAAVTFCDTAIWYYNGAWTPRTWTGTGPIARSGEAIAFDPMRGKVVMFGGKDTQPVPVPLADTWVWDGAAWMQETPVPAPGARAEHAMVLDPRRRSLVVFGGGADTATWEWNGTTWASTAATTAPGPVDEEHVLAVDVARARIVMQSNDQQTSGSSTWEYDGLGWRDLAPGTKPSYRRGAGFAYDPILDQAVMFGGGDLNGLALDETWTWNGAWTLMTPATHPTARSSATMIFDGQRVIAFGGSDDVGTANDETWTWDGSTWASLAPAHKPAARFGSAVGYDPIRRRVVVFGGYDRDSMVILGDTWLWDGTDWTDATPAGSPAARVGAHCAWDAARERLVMFGGTTNGATTEAWEWNGSTWTVVAATSQIIPLSDAGMFTLSGGGVMVVRASDTWRLRWERDASQADSCLDRADLDRDGLAGCDDLDCWGRCSPFCPPGTSCPATSPRCGDGVCDPTFESCELCPQDCTCAVTCGDFTCAAGETIASCPGDCTP